MIKLNYWLSYGSMRNCHIINHTNWDTNFLFYFVNLLLKEAHRWPQKTSSKISQKKKKKLRKEFGPREHAYARTLRSKPQNLCLRSPKST